MTRWPVATAVVAVLLLSGCRPTEWPSAADREEFCVAVSGPPFTEEQYDELERVGTPETLPYQARRYLLHLAEGRPASRADKAYFTAYVAAWCPTGHR